LGTLTSASAVHLCGLAILAATMRPRHRRGRNRQRGNTRGEKHPGHHNFSFRTAKTDSPSHRSNA
jgi:hypothetical protein